MADSSDSVSRTTEDPFFVEFHFILWKTPQNEAHQQKQNFALLLDEFLKSWAI